ncbi:type III secretion system inner rod subunit SctI [Burkholderia sp. Bp8986]|uniref:type III secretion system inner rod subunit SctI n=1 Tax=Burkholderia sp. Bp8986 TaxID=2184550 RepID=UPI000F5A9D6F|nr:type III secretion system inner rod subunit SctI [Burkholderia sp. Bp8986]RQS44920.1 EscI/YscI/HrpB family type III secretion system inner rod protein [Burkholderia sp. Bp8986]
MEINPVSASMTVSGTGGAANNVPGSDSVSFSDEMQFQRAMDGAARPEDSVLQPLQSAARQFSDMMGSIPDAGSEFNNPQTMLSIQEKIMEASTAVDIAAKVAGGVSQAVNKTLSMQ